MASTSNTDVWSVAIQAEEPGVGNGNQPVLVNLAESAAPLASTAASLGWRVVDGHLAGEARDRAALVLCTLEDTAHNESDKSGSNPSVRQRYPHALIVAMPPHAGPHSTSLSTPEPTPDPTPDATPKAGLKATSPSLLLADVTDATDAFDLASPERSGAGIADLSLPVNPQPAQIRQLLHHAHQHWRRNLKVLELVREIGLRRQRMHQLSEIGIALSSRRDFAGLLETILSEARRIVGCDAGSLYLVDKLDPDNPVLVFKHAQNDSFDVPFVEKRLPMTEHSLAGYVATSGKELNIVDVYRLPPDLPYKFNDSFDRQMDYHTKSTLVLPMRDHRDEVVGVLQFLNLLDPETHEAIAFGEEVAELLRAVASQAAVSIQKDILVRDINQLFESFVQASVKTIEQRDPSTSGHSFRVAETTVDLLTTLPRSGLARFRDLRLSKAHLTEVRYAALLHDFGKIGVREDILVKANKLNVGRLDVIQYRVELQKERLRRRAVEDELEHLHHGEGSIEEVRRAIHRRLEKDLSVLDQYHEWVMAANSPNMVDEGTFGHLQEIRDYAFREPDGSLSGIIDDNDLLALSVRRGSLTPAERQEIQSHVVHTRDFLAALPWPPELRQVPAIAGAHHEKLDGSGYPQGLVGKQIPLASRVMAVCDIYDALTAMDRPYKPAMPSARAYDILQEEAGAGLLDLDIVNVFIDSRKGPQTESPRAPRAAPRHQFSTVRS